MATSKKVSKQPAAAKVKAVAAKVKTTEIFSPQRMPMVPYPSSKGVAFASVLGKKRGDKIGLYYGEIEPGREIVLEVHDKTTETIYILRGKAVAFDKKGQEVPMGAGQILHIPTTIHHGLRNVGTSKLKILVIGSPDY
jgi:mannose-6-phosphate isomerase-like protein (cupin superfamily)